MANKIGDLYYKITGDTTSLDKNIKKSNTTVTGFGKKLGTIGTILKGALFTGAIIKAGKVVIQFGKNIIGAASDAEETANKFNVVFASVADDAQEAANRIKDEFKLSDETVQDFLSGVGDITSGLGATSEEALDAAEQITTLGLDINSFANLSGGAEQAVKALTSLFTGEREAAKALGIVINDTNLKAYAEDMGKVFKELTPLEKGFLSLELATTQSQLAIGDFARSSDSFANTQKAATEATKDLYAALGQSLLPAATSVLSIFDSLTRQLTSYITEHNELRTLLDKFENDKDTAQDRLDLTQKEVDAAQDLYDKNYALLKLNAESEETKYTKIALDILYEKSALLNTDLRTKQRLLDTLKEEVAAEKAISDAVIETAKEEETLATLKLDASSRLDELRKESLTDNEKALSSLQEEINYWWEFRDIVGVQEILNNLVEKRTALVNEEATAIEEAAQIEIDAATEIEEAKNELWDESAARNAERREEELAAIGEKYEEQERLRLEDLAKEKAVIQEKIDLAFQYANSSIEFLTSLDAFATAVGENELARLEENGASEDELAAKKKELAIEAAKRKKAIGLLNVGIDTASAIIGFLANPGGIPGIVLSVLAGVTGAIQAATIAATPLPSFATGGSYITDGPEAIMVGDNPSGRERVTVDPLSGNSGAGGMTHIIVNLNKRPLLEAVGQATKDGTLIIDSRSVK